MGPAGLHASSVETVWRVVCAARSQWGGACAGMLLGAASWHIANFYKSLAPARSCAQCAVPTPQPRRSCEWFGRFPALALAALALLCLRLLCLQSSCVGAPGGRCPLPGRQPSLPHSTGQLPSAPLHEPCASSVCACCSFSQYVSTIEWLKTRLTAAGERFVSGAWRAVCKNSTFRCGAVRCDRPAAVEWAPLRCAARCAPKHDWCAPKHDCRAHPAAPHAGFGYRFISGSMPLKQRAKAIQQ